MKRIIIILMILIAGIGSTKLKAQCLGAPSFFNYTADICDNSSYFFNNQNLTTIGIYYDTTVNYVGCDSIIELFLIVHTPSLGFGQHSICAGSSYLFNGKNLTTTGLYNDTISIPAICDSIFTLSLIVIQPSLTNIAKSICSGSSFNFNNQTITQAGIYYDTLLNHIGCDSIIKLTVTINQSTSYQSQTICSGNSIIFNNKNLTASGLYYDTLINYLGCDSIIQLNLFVANCSALTAVPDINFRNWLVANGFANCMNAAHDSIHDYCSQVLNTLSLNVDNQNIATLKGLQVFKNLAFLSCRNNSISSFDSLPKHLGQLYCENNLLTSLPPLPDTMYEINCSRNLLSGLPPLPSVLTNLFVSDNQINSIASFPNTLLFINCDSNLLTQLPALPLTLTALNCGYNLLTSLPNFTNSLVSLKANNNQITLLNSLDDSLQYLWINDNPNLSCLPPLRRLNYINITNTNIGCIPKYSDLNTVISAGQSLPLCTTSNPNQCAAKYSLNETHVNLVTDYVSTPPNTPIAIDMFLNDSVGIYSDSLLYYYQLATVISLNTYNSYLPSIFPRLYTIYTPAQNFVGLDTILYVVLDSGLLVNSLGSSNGAIYRYDTGRIIINVDGNLTPPAGRDTILCNLGNPIRLDFPCSLSTSNYLINQAWGNSLYSWNPDPSAFPDPNCPDGIIVTPSVTTSYVLKISCAGVNKTLYDTVTVFIKQDTINKNICITTPYFFNNQNLNVSGTYYDTLQSFNGCDSVVILNLNVLQPITYLQQTVCNTGSYTFNNQTLTNSGLYYDTLQNYLGCDSIIALNLLLTNTTYYNYTVNACGTTYISPLYKTYNQNGVYHDTIPNYVGCDSVITLTLFLSGVIPPNHVAINQYFSHWLFTHGYSSAVCGFYLDTLNVLVNSAVKIDVSNNYIPDLSAIKYFKSIDTLICNNLLAILYLPKTPNTLRYLDISNCSSTSLVYLSTSLTYLDMKMSYVYNRSPLPSNLIYFDCSSSSMFFLATLPTILPSNLQYLKCGGNSITALPSLPSSLIELKCDDTYITSLPSLPSSLKNLNCSYNNIKSISGLPNGLVQLNCAHDSLSSLPIFTDSLQYLNCVKNQLTSLPILSHQLITLKCDSNAISCLPLLPSTIQNLSFTNTLVSCVNTQSNNITSAPSLSSFPLCTASNPNGCMLCNATAANISKSICSGSSFTFNGQSLNTGGIYYDTLVNYSGCDSIIILTLSVNISSTSSISQSICSNSSFTFNGQSLNSSGFYNDTIINYLGCDSIITLNLSVLLPSTSTTSQSICSGSSIIFNGQSLGTSGSYNDTLINYLGCDSIITLALIVNSNPVGALAITSQSCLQPTLCVACITAANGGTPPYNLTVNSSHGGVYSSSNKTICYTTSKQDSVTLLVIDANGCLSTTIDTIHLAKDCVWPGDANSDLVADNLDIFPIGLLNGVVGPTRTNASLIWIDQPATSFGVLSNGIDAKHADCNGDGIIDGNDTMAILQNYGLTHLRQKSGNDFISTTIGPDTLYENTTANIVVNLGSAALPLDSVYGVAFSFHVDPTAIDTNSISINLPSSWLFANATDHFKLFKISKSDTRVDVGLVRNNHIAKSGYGTIVNITIDITTGNIIGREDALAAYNKKYRLHYSIDNIYLLKINNEITAGNVAQDSALILYTKPDGIETIHALNLTQSLSPNPANNLVSLKLKGYNLTDKKTVIILDAIGRVLMQQAFTGNQTNINIAELYQGIYVVKVISKNGITESKLIKQ